MSSVRMHIDYVRRGHSMAMHTHGACDGRAMLYVSSKYSHAFGGGRRCSEVTLTGTIDTPEDRQDSFGLLGEVFQG